GWNSHEEDAVFQLLVPLKPRHGHAFHLELGTAGEMLAKDACVCVELECTCTGEQLEESTVCFLHHPEEELRRNQGPSHLGNLCTSPYLDMQKTACWFQNLVRSACVLLPQLHHYNMKVLPSSCSCKLQLTNVSGRILSVEMIFGVQEGDLDIFLSSQS
ncbi:IPIL1 protein, partial [Uria aalge]|nr:IPIL1 protein [Uria aalge]